MFYNAVEMLFDELDMGLEEFKQLCRKSPEPVIQKIKSKDLSSLSLVLADDLKLKDTGTPFITKGTNLIQYLDAFIQRLAKDAEFESPPCILPTPEINRYLQKKIGRAFNIIIDKVLKSIKIGAVYETFDRDRDLKNIVCQFGELIGTYLSTPMIISGLLNAFRSEAPVSLIEQSTRTAFVAMAVLNNHPDHAQQTGDERRDRLIKLGLSVLFQDIACILDTIKHWSPDSPHDAASADIAAGMGLPETCVQTIR